MRPPFSRLGKFRPKQRRSARNLIPAMVGVGIACTLLIIAIAMWAGGVFRVRTADGVLIVEVNEPNPELYVDGDKVTVTWGADGHKAEIALKPGTHQVEVKKGGFAAAGETVTLSDGGRKVLTASLSRLPPDKPLAKRTNPKTPVSDPPKAKFEKPKENPAEPPQCRHLAIRRQPRPRWSACAPNPWTAPAPMASAPTTFGGRRRRGRNTWAGRWKRTSRSPTG